AQGRGVAEGRAGGAGRRPADPRRLLRRLRPGRLLRAALRGPRRRDRRGRARPHAPRRALRAGGPRCRPRGRRALVKEARVAEARRGASDPSPEELVARARALVPALRERSERCERERRVPEESIRELKHAGLFRILQPRAYGGYELAFAAYVRVSIELGRGRASTAWGYENNSMHHLILALSPAGPQRCLWGSGEAVRDARIASTGWSPRRAGAMAVDGGYVLDGHWEFASGSFNCDLDLLLAPVERPGRTGGPPEMRLFVLERAAR